jgi:hypothetical protein
MAMVIAGFNSFLSAQRVAEASERSIYSRPASFMAGAERGVPRIRSQFAASFAPDGAKRNFLRRGRVTVPVKNVQGFG